MTHWIAMFPLALPAPAARTAGRLRIALAAVVAVVTVLVTPAPAFAHAHLTGSHPAAGARLAVAPSALTLTFSESPELAVSSLRLVDGRNIQVALGTLAHGAVDHAMTAEIIEPLSAGRYTVSWQVAGADGHVTRGTFEFSIADGAAGLHAGVTSDSVIEASAPADIATVAQPSSFDASSRVYVVIRWVQFAGLLLLIGAVAFRWWVLPRVGGELEEAARRELARGAAGAGLWGGWLLALSALLRLGAQSVMTHGASGMLRPSSLGSMLGGTIWGHGWILEIVGLVLVIAVLRYTRRQPASPSAWRFAAAGVLALAFVPALSGHAVAARTLEPLPVLTDALHVLGGGAWLGGLAVMLLVGVPLLARAPTGERAPALGRMVSAFSPLALTGASLVVATGVFAAWLHLGSISALWQSSYGLVLFRKLIVVAMLLVAAAYNWRRVKPSLVVGGEEAARRLRRSGGVELVLAVVVLLMTAVLVASPTPMDVLRP